MKYIKILIQIYVWIFKVGLSILFLQLPLMLSIVFDSNYFVFGYIITIPVFALLAYITIVKHMFK